MEPIPTNLVFHECVAQVELVAAPVDNSASTAAFGNFQQLLLLTMVITRDHHLDIQKRDVKTCRRTQWRRRWTAWRGA